MQKGFLYGYAGMLVVARTSPSSQTLEPTSSPAILFIILASHRVIVMVFSLAWYRSPWNLCGISEGLLQAPTSSHSKAFKSQMPPSLISIKLTHQTIVLNYGLSGSVRTVSGRNNRTGRTYFGKHSWHHLVKLNTPTHVPHNLLLKKLWKLFLGPHEYSQ